MITPGVDPQGQPLDPKKIQHHFEDFYEDLFEELSKYGEIQNLNICDNLADHMVIILRISAFHRLLLLLFCIFSLLSLGFLRFVNLVCVFSSLYWSR